MEVVEVAEDNFLLGLYNTVTRTLQLEVLKIENREDMTSLSLKTLRRFSETLLFSFSREGPNLALMLMKEGDSYLKYYRLVYFDGWLQMSRSRSFAAFLEHSVVHWTCLPYNPLGRLTCWILHSS